MRNEDLVETLIRLKYITNENIKNAFLSVDRKYFIPGEYRSKAYYDDPLPIGYNQTISAPSIVATMLELLDIGADDKILEIGTGSGYNACLLAALGKVVYTIERIPQLREFAKQNMQNCAHRDKIVSLLGDGSEGYVAEAPYNKIIVTCGAPDVPAPLVEQLAVGGRMLIPVGGTFFQELYIIERRDDGVYRKIWGDVAFVPLIGKYGHRWA